MSGLNVIPDHIYGRRGFLRTAMLAGAVGMLHDTPAYAAAQEVRRYQFNAQSFGAVGDGAHDDTDAIQKALDHASRQGGGIVTLPAGKYLLRSSLVIPEEVVLEGISRGPISHARQPGLQGNGRAVASPPATKGPPASGLTLPDPPVVGIPATAGLSTTLLAVAQRGKEDGNALITMGSNAALRGLTIWYPHQNRDKTPVPYPWTIRMKGDNITVENVEILNPWQGINADQTQRHLIRNVTGQPLRMGIYLDRVYDIGRIENVHFNPWWCHNQPIREFMYCHGESFVFGRSDWEYVFNTFSYGYHIGYRFIEGETGACNGNFLGIGADGSCEAVRVDQSQAWMEKRVPHGANHPAAVDQLIAPGLLITNGEFVSLNILSHPVETDPTQVVVAETNKGPVRFNNCSFWGPARRIANLAGSGTVGFDGCTFVEWDAASCAIQAESKKLLVNSCEFQQEGCQVTIGVGVRQAVISGNIFTGQEHITNNSTGSVEIGLNSAG